MKHKPDIKAQFIQQADVVTRKIEELDDAVVWLVGNLEQIASGKVNRLDTRKFAKQAIYGLSLILTNDLK